MDTLSFIAALVDSLAWPVAVIVLLLMFRRAVAELIPGLQRLKYGDVQLDFGRQLAEVNEGIGAGSTAAPEAAARTRADAPRGAEPSLGRYFQSLAEVSPRAAILESWLAFELAANHAVQALGLGAERGPLSMDGLLAVLRAQGLLTDAELDALARLRGLRNHVVHGPEPNVSVDLVGEYAAVLKRIAERVQARLNERQAGHAEAGPTR